MCRLGGVALGTGQRSPAFYGMLSAQLAELLINMDVAQGGDGVGVAVHYADGSYRLFKSPKRAWDAYRQWWDDVEAALPGAVAVQMHARLATQGSSEDPNNLHPIVRGPIVGAHNGIIWNDVEIFEYLEAERQGKVDSEAIFALLERYAPDLNMEGVQVVAECLEGSFAFTAMSQQAPGRVLLVAGNGQLCYARSKATNTVWWASTEALLPKSARRGATIVRMGLGDALIVDASQAAPSIHLEELPNVDHAGWSYYRYLDDYEGWLWADGRSGTAGRAADPATSYRDWDRRVIAWEEAHRQPRNRHNRRRR